MKTVHRVLFSIGICIALTLIFYFVTSAITRYTGYLVSESADLSTSFEICLREQDITLFINSQDSSKTLKGIKLNHYLKDIKIMNCLRNNNYCLEKGISSFPAWIINGDKIEKDISISELVKFSKCKLD